MENYRGTYAQINLNNLYYNVSEIVKYYSNYNYKMGVVKADCYGYYGSNIIDILLKSGINYLCVSSLEEAIDIRKQFKNIPILCLGYIDFDYITECINNNITITIISKNSFIELISKDIDISGLKLHLKINTGMNRLGIKDKDEFKYIVDECIKRDLKLEGVFTHICKVDSLLNTQMQFDIFKTFLDYTAYFKFKIVHLPSSNVLFNYEKLSYINGYRIGIAMYGFVPHKQIKFKSTFKLISKVIQLQTLNKGEGVSYDLNYIANKTEKIAIVAIGYADGVNRKNTGRYVYINNNKYQIVGNICMDMLMIKVDNLVRVNDKVEILKDNEHILEVSKYLGTIPYEIICNISKRVPRKYISRVISSIITNCNISNYFQ